MVPPGASPATYEPRPQQMVSLTRSRIYFSIGVPFERIWLEKIKAVNPSMRLVPTDRGIEKHPMRPHLRHPGEASHAEVRKGHGIRDPHIWLSPPLVMIQARHMMEALADADPENRDVYAGNYRRFIKELEVLDRRIRGLFAKTRSLSRFMVYHPSWGYFARAYDLEQIPIELEGKEPTIQEIQALIRFARQEDVRVVFVQPQFSTKSARTIADAAGARVVTADPLSPDWAENLLEVAEAFSRAAR
jgi:zinc transport system substrate-binding protein